ncbi:MAG: hypothetical protein AW11_03441 [Candidatus Accumulibacter regalis]|jgi:hypothetical protein|uniref:Uncharacterized protein n=1 Tax=Accumulibacter regalis TaxID=522306 RepID=A0A011Q8Q8_ACCRE|nr:MAG: hypothetical protein AW11_03441 [Candidatus Accumulibacter regalis]
MLEFKLSVRITIEQIIKLIRALIVLSLMM